jgi:delta-aminolevulinic acid dehydratase/porphobilinogen synthase
MTRDGTVNHSPNRLRGPLTEGDCYNGWLDEKPVVLEMLTGFRRAVAEIILTYWAQDVARWLKT